MYYPYIQEMKTQRKTLDYFKGYNHNLKISESEFFDMKNMSSVSFPLLSPRGRRGIYAKPEKATGLIEKDSLCYIDGTDFVMNEYRIDMGLSDEVPKQLISMGAYVIILPDRKYINTKDLSDFGNIDAEFTTAEGESVSFELCRDNGDSYGNATVSATEPVDPENLALWLDTSSEPHSLKQYSESAGMWMTIATTYIKISATGIGKNFGEYDGVTISGVEDEKLSDLNGNFVLWGKGDDYIVVVGIIDNVTSQTSSVTVKRQMPLMDFVIESGNRLWGCRYGVAHNGDVVNEIYASKLGDFKNWNCFMGISTDSYAAAVGTDGMFTGAVTHLGYPTFFKENCMHKVYGTQPSNFQIQDTVCRGVQRGCDRSLAIVNESLYYKTKNGVCVYDGSLPVEISSQFGEILYSEAVGGAHDNKYYVSMKDPDGIYNLFVFDASKRIWHREDETQAVAFCSAENELFFIDAKDGFIKTVFGSGTLEADPVPWGVETGIFGTDSPDRKYISRLGVRMSLEIGTDVEFFIQYDSTGVWVPLASVTGTSLRSFVVPLRPKRCDHFRLRISGSGEAKIFSITKVIEEGSDSW